MTTNLVRVLPRPADVRRAEGVLHDVRGSLTVIRGQCHAIVRSGGATEQSIARLRVIDAEVERIADAVLTVRRAMDGAGAPSRIGPVDLSVVAAEAVCRLEGAAGERGVHLRLFVGTPAPVVDGDADELRRVLDNLVTNAIRWTPHGGAVSVSVDRVRDQVVMRVIDDGNRFGDRRAVNDAPAGWGMGLGIVADVVSRHGGIVRFEPRRLGTAVRVELPQGRPAAEATP